MSQMHEPLLSVVNLKLYYPRKIRQGNHLRSQIQYIKAVDGISFDVYKGETFGLVGESGCGKSTIGKTIVRLLSPTDGQVRFGGKDIFAPMEKRESSLLSQKIQIIFQDPYSSLDPRFTVGRLIAEPMVIQNQDTKKKREERVRYLMQEVGLREEQYTRYAHEFSGGQRQRIGVARALATEPDLIVCDEPVSALDVSIRAQILNLMVELQRKFGLTYIFISHDLSVVKHICDRIAVMYLGNIVEITDKESLFSNPLHPYTKALMAAIPVPDPDVKSMNQVLEGEMPSPLNPPLGCCFQTRCSIAHEDCARIKPVLEETLPGHRVACPYCQTNERM